MVKPLTWFLLMLLALAGLGLGVRAEEPPPETASPARIRQLIEQLNAPNVEDREKAEQALLQIGEPSLMALKIAQQSPIPEVSARARRLVKQLGTNNKMPKQSIGASLPQASMVFLEVPDLRRTATNLAGSPLGKLWADAAVATWWRKYVRDELDEMEQQEIEIRGKIADLADGRAVLALGPPGTFLDEEIDPPWILVLEHKAVNALEPLFREYWDLEGDPPDQPKQIGNYAVLEHAAGSQSLYLPNASIFAAGASGMDVLLKGMEEAPKPSLEPEILAARELLPESDLALILRRDGMDKLAEGVPDLAVFDVPATLDALGWAPGSRALGAFKLTPKGLEERYLANFTDAAGLVPILAALPVAEAPAAGAPLALDAIPPHAALWVSCRGQLAPQAKAVAVALRKLDLALTVGALGPPPPNPANPQQPQLPGAGIVSRIDELERAMGKLEALLEQVQGGIELGVLVKAVGEELPADPPLALVLSAVLKDAAAVQGALERLTKADVTTWEKAEVGGGAHYRLLGYDEPPGVWIKDNRLIYASEPAVLSLALAALQHAKGNERLADRADVQAWLKDEALSPKCALRILGDAGQFLEMPYGLWHNLYSDFNEANPWPAFPAVLRPHLGRFRVELTPGAKADEVEVRAFSPVPLAAMVYVVFKPFVDLGW